MNCPHCKIKAWLLSTRQATDYIATHRKYRCDKCGMTFSTSEKIMFGSLPADIRNKFLESGER